MISSIGKVTDEAEVDKSESRCVGGRRDTNQASRGLFLKLGLRPGTCGRLSFEVSGPTQLSTPPGPRCYVSLCSQFQVSAPNFTTFNLPFGAVKCGHDEKETASGALGAHTRRSWEGQSQVT